MRVERAKRRLAVAVAAGEQADEELVRSTKPRLTDVNLNRLQLTTHETRRAWAINKSRQLAKAKADVAAGIQQPGTTPITDAVLRYKTSCAQRLRERTIQTYSGATEQFTVYLSESSCDVTEMITGPILSGFREHLLGVKRHVKTKGGRRGEDTMSGERRSPATINCTLRAVKTLLEHWRRWGLLNVSRDEVRDSLENAPQARSRPQYLPLDAIKSLLNAAERHDAETFGMTREEKANGGESRADARGVTRRYEPIMPFVTFVLLTGCRAGEAQALTWDDVNLKALDEHGEKAGEIVLKPTATKTHDERVIDLGVSPGCRNLLAALKLLAGNSPYVFGGNVPLTRSRIEAARKRLTARYGAPEFTWQQLRQTCGTYLTNAPGIFGAASAYRSARQLGHSVEVAQRHYVGLIRGIPKGAITLDAAMQLTDEMRFIRKLHPS